MAIALTYQIWIWLVKIPKGVETLRRKEREMELNSHE